MKAEDCQYLLTLIFSDDNLREVGQILISLTACTENSITIDTHQAQAPLLWCGTCMNAILLVFFRALHPLGEAVLPGKKYYIREYVICFCLKIKQKREKKTLKVKHI